MNRSLVLAAAVLLSAAPAAVQAQSARINIAIDQSQRIQLRGQASSVIVGNPQIADVTVVDANTLFVVGKGYGVTEVAVVDAAGRTLFQSPIVVSAPSGLGQVRMWRGAQVTEMTCGGSCAPSLRAQAGGSAPSPSAP